jgi:peptidoglycan/LPS O-acetylase OafA/YrhL
MTVSPSSPLPRENSFTFLRLVFAMLVVWGHACLLGGFGEEPIFLLTKGAISGRELAVEGFFILSGFLIAKSLAENSSLWRFACHRAFRILPAFWVYLSLIVFIVAPVLIAARWPDRFSYGQLLTVGPRSAWYYFGQNWALQAQESSIVPLFANNSLRYTVNGSLWSVHFEAVFYICAAAAGGAWQLSRRTACLAAGFVVVGILGLSLNSMVAVFVAVALLWRAVVRRGWGMLTLFVLLYSAEAMIAFAPGTVALLPESFLLGLRFLFDALWRISGLTFLGGMLCWRYRAWLRWDVRAFLLAVSLLVAGATLHQWRLVAPLALPYVVLYLAARLPFQKVERWGDYSYGIYIFSFPIQQLLCHWGLHRLGFPVYLGGSIIVSLATGVLSWWLVEKPALRLGRRLGAWSPVRGEQTASVVAVELPPVIESMPSPSP